MKKAFISFVFVFAVITVRSQPLPVKSTHNIIIDTDCGIDDMRAISFILSRPEIIIRGILTTEGSLTPAEGAVKVVSLLHEFGKDNITVASGDRINGINPSWREFNRNVIWGDETTVRPVNLSALKFLTENLENTNDRVTLVCLGPLTNIGKILKSNPGLLSGIDRIIWYNESVKPLQGFNYECDKESAEVLMKARVRVDVVSNLNQPDAYFDIEFFNECAGSVTELARILEKVFSQPSVNELLKQNHFRLYDDLVALYLTNPELFDMDIIKENPNVRYTVGYDIHGVREAFYDMINGIYVSEHNIVFNEFPVKREMFSYDIRPIIDTVIARYGYDEWKANVMTDEFHGHLGVFSIVGAKMGIKARELLDAGPDELQVVTYAGSIPPYSCLNDGIQVSTGATLGMGTIRIAKVKKTSPSAVFTYKGRSLNITLKKEYLEQVEADIKEGILKFGLMDDGYWKLIRRNAIKYWLKWDRNKIFDVGEINQKNKQK